MAWLNSHEALFIFLAILLEESGIPMPIPADIAMALAGYRVAQGQMSLLEAFMIGQSATLIGSSILYWAGRRGGRPLLARYGRFLFLNAERLAQAERLITRLGPLAVVIGRQIPGLRLASPLACGVFQIPYLVFLPAMFVGSTVYIGAFIALGVYGGPTFLTAFEANAFPFRFVLTTITLIASLRRIPGGRPTIPSRRWSMASRSTRSFACSARCRVIRPTSWRSGCSPASTPMRWAPSSAGGRGRSG